MKVLSWKSKTVPGVKQSGYCYEKVDRMMHLITGNKTKGHRRLFDALFVTFWYARQDSNLRPTDSKSGFGQNQQVTKSKYVML